MGPAFGLGLALLLLCLHLFLRSPLFANCLPCLPCPPRGTQGSRPATCSKAWLPVSAKLPRSWYGAGYTWCCGIAQVRLQPPIFLSQPLRQRLASSAPSVSVTPSLRKEKPAPIVPGPRAPSQPFSNDSSGAHLCLQRPAYSVRGRASSWRCLGQGPMYPSAATAGVDSYSFAPRRWAFGFYFTTTLLVAGAEETEEGIDIPVKENLQVLVVAYSDSALEFLSAYDPGSDEPIVPFSASQPSVFPDGAILLGRVWVCRQLPETVPPSTLQPKIPKKGRRGGPITGSSSAGLAKVKAKPKRVTTAQLAHQLNCAGARSRFNRTGAGAVLPKARVANQCWRRPCIKGTALAALGSHFINQASDASVDFGGTLGRDQVPLWWPQQGFKRRLDEFQTGKAPGPPHAHAQPSYRPSLDRGGGISPGPSGTAACLSGANGTGGRTDVSFTLSLFPDPPPQVFRSRRTRRRLQRGQRGSPLFLASRKGRRNKVLVRGF